MQEVERQLNASDLDEATRNQLESQAAEYQATMDNHHKDNEPRQVLSDTGSFNIVAEMENNPEFRSPLGGNQGSTGKLPIIGDYLPGSWQDVLVESFAGPHDFLNSWYWYADDGNIRPGLSKGEQRFGEILNAINVPLAAPLAAPNLIPQDLLITILGGK